MDLQIRRWRRPGQTLRRGGRASMTFSCGSRGGSRRRARGSGRGRICWGCYRGVSGRTAGRSPSWAGDATPDGMQRLLNFYSWSADDVRDDVREYVADELGGRGGVLIPDETGFLKKG